jgi:hypothetical protein
MSFTIALDQAQLDSLQSSLNFMGNGFPRAQMRSANYAADRTKTATYRRLIALITADTNRVKDSLTVTRATLATGTSVLNITGKAIPLFRFDVSFMYPTVTGGVTAKIFKLGAAPTVLKHAFVAKMKSGHVGVFSREGKNRYPLQEHFGPNASRVFERTPGVESDLMTLGAEKYLDELNRQIGLLFTKEFGIDPPEEFI